MKIPDYAPSNVVAARPWHLIYLAERLRPDEQDGWKAFTGMATYDPDVAIKAMLATPGLAFAVLNEDGTPAVAGGFTNVRGHAWDGWMVGTMDGWEQRWRSITRAVRWLMGEMIASGATRMSVTTLASRTEARQWYERSLGMRCEGILRCAGANGEDLAIYARVSGDPR